MRKESKKKERGKSREERLTEELKGLKWDDEGEGKLRYEKWAGNSREGGRKRRNSYEKGGEGRRSKKKGGGSCRNDLEKAKTREEEEGERMED